MSSHSNITKRKSSSSPASNKRQRLDTPNSPSHDSLSTLSDNPSSPEVGLAAQQPFFASGATAGGADSAAVSDEDEGLDVENLGDFEDLVDDDGEAAARFEGPGNGGGGGSKGVPGSASKGIPGAATAAGATEDEDADEDDDEDDEDEAEATATDPSHHTLSAKSVPSHQPRPLNGSPSKSGKKGTTGNGAGPLKPTVGGKGKKGEEALEHAVAAREEVERRRVELKGASAKQSGLPSASSVAGHGTKKPLLGEDGEAIDAVASVKVKEEEQEAAVEGEEEDGAATVKRERPAIAEERANIIRFVVVTNDSAPDSLIILTGLKNIFQKQLPKMPREYIARLVYDRNHYSMAIVKRGLEVVGGITYRPFEARRFAEIVFCAITGTEQVKGYGSHLMNHLKDHVKASTSCMHFLTYADNYAIGYFKKQGFTKEVGLDRSVWAGYIKDYEGGTIMHCSMLERIKYLEVGSILARQKEVILAQIRQNSHSHIVHPGLSLFQTLAPGASLDPSLVPGLKESGWTPEMDALTRRPVRGPQFAIMQRLHTQLVDHPNSWAFAQPVNGAEVTDYYKVITQPMDLATMETKLESNKYSTVADFVADAKLIFDNCRAYNDAGSNYVKNANKLEAYLMDNVKQYDVE